MTYLQISQRYIPAQSIWQKTPLWLKLCSVVIRQQQALVAQDFRLSQNLSFYRAVVREAGFIGLSTFILITDIPENDTYGWNSLWTSCISSKLCQHFAALHSHTTSQHCQSWGAACVNTFQVCSWPSIRRTVLLLTLTQEALLVEISGSASHSAPKTSGKITIARMGVLRS